MDSEGKIDLKKLHESDLSVIAWLNNALRQEKLNKNYVNVNNLEDRLLNISQSCTSIITEFTESIETKMKNVNDMLNDLASSSEENKNMISNINSKINECSSLISKSEKKYTDNSSIEEVIMLFNKKEKLENVMKLLINNSKFESLLSEIEYILKDKNNFVLLINEQGDEFYDIIDKICILKLLVGSLESIPEFLNRIERFKLLEKSVMSILDDVLLNLFISDQNNDLLFELLNIYSKLNQDSRLYKYLIDIIINQISLVWNLVWSLTTFGSQNGRNIDFDNNSNEKKNVNKIIFLPSIQDLEGLDISQDMLRISEDDAIRRYFNWFNELIIMRNKAISALLMKFKDKTSDFMKNIINYLLKICLNNTRDFLNTILITITNSVFIFPESDSERYDIDNDSIFGINQDSILTTDIKEIHAICERILISIINGLNDIMFNNINDKNNEYINVTKDNIISNYIFSDKLLVNSISEIFLNNESNIIQSILLCDISWIFQMLKKISVEINLIINKDTPIIDYSSVIETKNAFLIERISTLFKKDKLYETNSANWYMPKPLPNKECITLFVNMIDYSIKYYFENVLIHLLNPIQNIIRTKTLNLINTYQKRSGNITISNNSLDKELLSSCFLFHCTLLKTRKSFEEVICDAIIHCKSTNIIIGENNNNDDVDTNENDSNSNGQNNLVLTLKLLLASNKIDLTQYSIFNRIKYQLNDEIKNAVFCNNNEVNENEIIYLVKDLESIKLISQMILDSVEIMSQCCSYPILAFLEGYKGLELWNMNTNLKCETQSSEFSDKVDGLENEVIMYIEKNKIQPSNLIVSIGEYMLNIAVIIETTFNSNMENSTVQEVFTDSESNLIPKIIERVSVIVFDTIKRQIIDIEVIGELGYIHLFVDIKYLISVFEILMLYNSDSDDDNYVNKNKELIGLSQSLIYIITKVDYSSISCNKQNDSKTDYWYKLLIQKDERRCR